MADELRLLVRRSGSLIRCWVKRLGHALQARWRTLRLRWHGPPVLVMVADRTRQRALEREVRRSLRRLATALGQDVLNNLTVVGQHVIVTNHPLAGCYHVGQRADGANFALVRLALTVGGRTLSTDEILAALAEQYLGLVLQESGGMSVTVPVELDVIWSGSATLPPLTHDPLSPSSNGHLSRPNQLTTSITGKE